MPSYPPFEDEVAGGGVPNYRMDPYFPILRGHMQTLDGDCLIDPVPPMNHVPSSRVNCAFKERWMIAFA